MSQVQVATDITAALQQVIAAHTEYPLVIEQQNKTVVDQATQDDPYLRIEIRHLAADQMDLSPRPRVEKWGQIHLIAVCKPGAGTARVKALLDFATPYFELKRVGIVQCQAVHGTTGKLINGLWCEPAIVNFYYHETI